MNDTEDDYYDNRADPAGDDEQPQRPTFAEPLLGLRHLSKLALVGRDNILARARALVPYVWQDIAVAATIIVIAGGVGEGKTSLLFLILAARANLGAPVTVLGRAVSPAPAGHYVVVIEGEHGEGSTSRKAARSCEAIGVADTALDRMIIVARKAVRIGSAEWDDVTRLVAAGLVSDIAIDTIARCAPSDANSESEQVAIFELVSRTIDAAPTEADKPVVWVCAHRRKGGADGLESVSGSAQRTGQADSVLVVVGEKVGGRIVSSTVTCEKLREDPDDFPLPVTFSIVVTDGKRRVHYADTPPNDDRPLEARILDVLATGPRTKNAIADKLGRSRGDVDDALTVLFSEHAISTTTVKVKGVDRKAFELAKGANGHRTNTPDDPFSNGYRTGHREGPVSS